MGRSRHIVCRASARNEKCAAGYAFAASLTPIGWALIGVGALTAVISIAFSVCTWNDAEQWVVDGFWGRSKKYWGDGREDLAMADQITKSHKISDHMNNGRIVPADPIMQNHFNKEMEEYYALTWGIAIENRQKGDGMVTLRFPGWVAERDDIKTITVSLSYIIKIASGAGVHTQYNPIRAGRVRSVWQDDSLINVDLTEKVKAIQQDEKDPDKKLVEEYAPTPKMFDPIPVTQYCSRDLLFEVSFEHMFPHLDGSKVFTAKTKFKDWKEI